MVIRSSGLTPTWTAALVRFFFWSDTGVAAKRSTKFFNQVKTNYSPFQDLKYLPSWPKFCWSQPQWQLPGNQGGGGQSNFPTQCTINNYSQYSLPGCTLYLLDAIDISEFPCSCFGEYVKSIRVPELGVGYKDNIGQDFENTCNTSISLKSSTFFCRVLPFQLPVTCMLCEHAGLLMLLLYSPILIWQCQCGSILDADKCRRNQVFHFSSLYICKWSVFLPVYICANGVWGLWCRDWVILAREFQGDGRWQHIKHLSKRKMYLPKLLNVFLQIVKCPNNKIYLSKLQNVFVPIAGVGPI